MLATARMVFAIAAKHGIPVHHADIPQAFLQENVSRPIFVTAPKGVSVKSHILDAFRKQNPHGQVCFRLIKSLYSLASSPHLLSKMLQASGVFWRRLWTTFLLLELTKNLS
mmetsp:Transcript_3398/g.11157  ORF Transcript_3398/g.11157 Transcript_3398/m.11157 type:complete len:111 (-) Transcript_3398:1333-1665(-)